MVEAVAATVAFCEVEVGGEGGEWEGVVGEDGGVGEEATGGHEAVDARGGVDGGESNGREHVTVRDNWNGSNGLDLQQPKQRTADTAQQQVSTPLLENVLGLCAVLVLETRECGRATSAALNVDYETRKTLWDGRYEGRAQEILQHSTSSPHNCLIVRSRDETQQLTSHPLRAPACQ